jgi:hypothetical protein
VIFVYTIARLLNAFRLSLYRGQRVHRGPVCEAIFILLQSTFTGVAAIVHISTEQRVGESDALAMTLLTSGWGYTVWTAVHLHVLLWLRLGVALLPMDRQHRHRPPQQHHSGAGVAAAAAPPGAHNNGQHLAHHQSSHSNSHSSDDKNGNGHGWLSSPQELLRWGQRAFVISWCLSMSLPTMTASLYNQTPHMRYSIMMAFTIQQGLQVFELSLLIWFIGRRLLRMLNTARIQLDAQGNRGRLKVANFAAANNNNGNNVTAMLGSGHGNMNMNNGNGNGNGNGNVGGLSSGHNQLFLPSSPHNTAQDRSAAAAGALVANGIRSTVHGNGSNGNGNIDVNASPIVGLSTLNKNVGVNTISIGVQPLPSPAGGTRSLPLPSPTAPAPSIPSAAAPSRGAHLVDPIRRIRLMANTILVVGIPTGIIHIVVIALPDLLLSQCQYWYPVVMGNSNIVMMGFVFMLQLNATASQSSAAVVPAGGGTGGAHAHGAPGNQHHNHNNNYNGTGGVPVSPVLSNNRLSSGHTPSHTSTPHAGPAAGGTGGITSGHGAGTMRAFPSNNMNNGTRSNGNGNGTSNGNQLFGDRKLSSLPMNSASTDVAMTIAIAPASSPLLRSNDGNAIGAGSGVGNGNGTDGSGTLPETVTNPHGASDVGVSVVTTDNQPILHASNHDSADLGDAASLPVPLPLSTPSNPPPHHHQQQQQHEIDNHDDVSTTNIPPSARAATTATIAH